MTYHSGSARQGQTTGYTFTIFLQLEVTLYFKVSLLQCKALRNNN